MPEATDLTGIELVEGSTKLLPQVDSCARLITDALSMESGTNRGRRRAQTIRPQREARMGAMPDTMQPAPLPSVYQLRVVVRGVSPLIWRRLLVRA
ncbi:MAG TPA: hypothetical protein VIJ15_09675, partial [Dermatophilaceae bacterium]